MRVTLLFALLATFATPAFAGGADPMAAFSYYAGKCFLSAAPTLGHDSRRFQ
jgi:hypothetical protein